MKMPTIHLTHNGESLCGKEMGFGTEDVKTFKKSLQPCQSCFKIYTANGNKKEKPKVKKIKAKN
jgi:ribosome-binding protein aMBF1 (putative translation factor)